MREIPNTIYLQVYGVDGDDLPEDGVTGIDPGGVCWCSDKIFDTDVPYIKADKPDAYAYRYPDGIRFNDGREINGNPVVEVIPLFYGTPIPRVR